MRPDLGKDGTQHRGSAGADREEDSGTGGRSERAVKSIDLRFGL